MSKDEIIFDNVEDAIEAISKCYLINKKKTIYKLLKKKKYFKIKKKFKIIISYIILITI